jgi:hypothetical protein
MLIFSMSYASVVLKPEWPFPVSRVSDRWSHHCRGQRNGVSKKDIFLISFVKSSCQALDLCVLILQRFAHRSALLCPFATNAVMYFSHAGLCIVNVVVFSVLDGST